MNPVRTIYFDHASTTRPDPRVREAMLPYLGEEYGNPSSHYYPLGQRSSRAVDQARLEVAALIGAKPEEIIFTSGGTEANNLAIKGLLAEAPRGKDHVVTSNIEHYSVLNALRALSGRGFSVTYLPVDDGGLLDPARVEAAITERTALVTVMQANGEIGVVQDIAALAAVAARRGSPVLQRRRGLGRHRAGRRRRPRRERAQPRRAPVLRPEGRRRPVPARGHEARAPLRRRASGAGLSLRHRERPGHRRARRRRRDRPGGDSPPGTPGSCRCASGCGAASASGSTS